MSIVEQNRVSTPPKDSDPTAQLVVVGTGIQWGGQTTLAAQRAIELADHVLFAVADPWAARWIRELCPGAEALVYSRDGRPRRGIYRAMVQRILEVMSDGGRICAVFYGCPAVLTQPAHDAIKAARAKGYGASMLPGVSFLDCLFVDLAIDPGIGGCHVLEAGDFFLCDRVADTQSHLILSQIGMMGNHGAFAPQAHLAVKGALRLLARKLCETYPNNHEVIVYEAAALPTERPRIDRVALADLGDVEVSGITTLYVPPLQASQLNQKRLAELTALYNPPGHTKQIRHQSNQKQPRNEDSL